MGAQELPGFRSDMQAIAEAAGRLLNGAQWLLGSAARTGVWQCLFWKKGGAAVTTRTKRQHGGPSSAHPARKVLRPRPPLTAGGVEHVVDGT